MKLNLSDVLDWGYMDINKLEEWLERAKKFDIDIEDVKQFIENIEGEITNINDWFYAVINLLFDAICISIIEQSPKIEKEIKELKDNFSPYINYLDSWFNNAFDELDFDKSKEEIIKDAIQLLGGKYD